MANELCYSSASNFKNKPSFFFYYLSLICSFIFSHPLYCYFSYFLLFSPYMFIIISFISPVFFTTALVLLFSFLTTTLLQPKLGFIQSVLEKLQSKLNDVEKDEEFRNFEDFDIHKIVFNDPPLIKVGDGDYVNEEVPVMETAIAVTATVTKGYKPEAERSLRSLFEEFDQSGDTTAAIETTEKESSSHRETLIELEKTETLVKKKLGSKSIAVVEADQTPFEKSLSVKSNSGRDDSASSFGKYGWTRKAKERKRTSSCKLFEEIHNSEGGEETMDLLWEAFNDDDSRRKSKNRKEPMINYKKTTVKNKNIEFEEEDDDEEKLVSNGHLCCLKALKLSAGNMNLRMGKPKLVKISKALKRVLLVGSCW